MAAGTPVEGAMFCERVVVGVHFDAISFYPIAFRCDCKNGRIDLMPAGLNFSIAISVSDDGNKTLLTTNDFVAYLHDQSTGAIELFGNFYPAAMTPDASVVVGRNSLGYPTWMAAGDAAPWPFVLKQGLATGVSNDGQFVCGTVLTVPDNWHRAFIWDRANNNLIDLHDDLLFDAGTTSYAQHISADASIVVGYATIGAEMRAVILDAGGATIIPLPDGATSSSCFGISPDSSTVFIEANFPSFPNTRLYAYSISSGEMAEITHAIPTGFTAANISRDGLFIVGDDNDTPLAAAISVAKPYRGKILSVPGIVSESEAAFASAPIYTFDDAVERSNTETSDSRKSYST